MTDLASFTALANLIELVRRGIADFSSKLQATHDQPWKEILLCLELLKNLTHAHVEAINRVVAPIEDGDIPSFCRDYRTLIHDPNFPTGYDLAHGVIGGARDLQQFREGEIHDRLKAITDELGKFQRVAFVLDRECDCWEIEELFNRARDLWFRMSPQAQPQTDSQVEQLKTDVRESFRSAFRTIPPPEDSEEHLAEFPINTSDDVVALLRAWCHEWQRRAEGALYGRHGLNYAIGRLRILAPKVE